MVAVPAEPPDTVPSLATVATALSLELQVISASAGYTLLIASFTVEPSSTETTLCLMLT